jgi:hypothetical protein
MQSVLDARSIVLELGRKARAEGNNVRANLLGETEEILSQFIDTPPNLVSEAYRRASALTRRKHEALTQGSIGSIRGYSKAGDVSRSPEGTLSALVRPGDEGAKTGKDIARVAAGDEIEGVSANKGMIQLAEDFIGDKFAGTTSGAGRERFLTQHGPLLRQFPSLSKTLGSVQEEVSNLAKEAARMKGRTANRSDRNKFYAARLLDTDPVKLPETMMSMPQADLAKLVKLLGREDAAIDGARNAVLENIRGRLINNRGEFGGTFLEPLLMRTPKLAKVFDTVLTKEQQSGLRSISSALEALNPAAVKGASSSVSDSLKGTAVYRLLSRLAGARAGAYAGRGGSSILAASAGARFSEAIANRMTAGKVIELLEEGLRDPKIMKTLLRPIKTNQQAKAVNDRLRGYLITLGYSEEE